MLNKSHFIPTPGIENLPHNLLIQKLVEERIRSVVMGDDFVDKCQFLVQHYLEIPLDLGTPDKVREHVGKEAKALMEVFKKYENETPQYAEAIQQLKHYENSYFKITSTTFSGIQLLIEIEDQTANA